MSNKVTRIVTGKKGVTYRGPKGEKLIALPGQSIEVSPEAAKAFADRLKDPAVVKAQAAAVAAQVQSLRAAEEAQQTALDAQSQADLVDSDPNKSESESESDE